MTREVLECIDVVTVGGRELIEAVRGQTKLYESREDERRKQQMLSDGPVRLISLRCPPVSKVTAEDVQVSYPSLANRSRPLPLRLLERTRLGRRFHRQVFGRSEDAREVVREFMDATASALKQSLESAGDEDECDFGRHFVRVGVRAIEQNDRVKVAPVVILARVRQCVEQRFIACGMFPACNRMPMRLCSAPYI